eukprot:Sspe_Gene.28705::Locus_13181_Transcript_1_1_Confidence_1.000_Length_3978::g.28705::m.28705
MEPFRFVLWMDPAGFEAGQDWIRRESYTRGTSNTDEAVERWEDQVAVVILRRCAVSSLASVSWVYNCMHLTYLDLSHCGLSSLGTPTLWEKVPFLRILLLHCNAIGKGYEGLAAQKRNREIKALAPLTALEHLTLYGNLLQGYRKAVACLLPGLKALDEHIIADSERYTVARLPALSVFNPLHDGLHVPLEEGGESHHALPNMDRKGVPLERRECVVLAYVRARLSYITQLHARLNPSNLIQRVWRGWRVRRDWGAAIWKAQRRAVQAAGRGPVLDGPSPPPTSPSPPPSFPIPSVPLSLVTRVQAMWRGFLLRKRIIKDLCVAGKVLSVFIPPWQLSMLQALVASNPTLKQGLGRAGNSGVILVRPHDNTTLERRANFPFVWLASSGAVLRKKKAGHRKRWKRWIEGVDCALMLSNTDYTIIQHHMARLASQGKPPAKPRYLQHITTQSHCVGDLLHAVHVHNRCVGSASAINLYLHIDTERISAAVTIQRAWRGHKTRRIVCARDLEEALLRKFCALKIQAAWRGWLARKRAKFLRRLREIITYATSSSSSDPGTEGCLSFSTYQQVLAAITAPRGKAVSMDIPPGTPIAAPRNEAEAIAKGILIRPDAPDGQCLSIACEYLSMLPGWLARVMAGGGWSYRKEGSVSLDDVILVGAQLGYASTPSRRSFTTILPNPSLPDLLRYRYGFMCFRYGTRSEALRRKVALAALTFHTPTDSFLCYEPPPHIIANDAAQVIQRWWLEVFGDPNFIPRHMRGRPTGSLAAEHGDSLSSSLLDSVSGGPTPQPPQTTRPSPGPSAERSVVITEAIVNSRPARVSRVGGLGVALSERFGEYLDHQAVAKCEAWPSVSGCSEGSEGGEDEMEVQGCPPPRDTAPPRHSMNAERAAARFEKQLRAQQARERRAKEEAEVETARRLRESKPEKIEDLMTFRSQLDGTVVRGAPSQAEVIMPKLKLSSALHRFASQAVTLEEIRERSTVAKATDFQGVPLAPLSATSLGSEDLKQLSARDISTLAAAKTARSVTFTRAEVAIRQKLWKRTKTELSKQKEIKAERKAEMIAADRESRSTALYNQWCATQQEIGEVRERKRSDLERLGQVRSARALAAEFQRHQNLVEKQFRKRHLLAVREQQLSEARSAATQRYFEAQEVKSRVARFAEMDLANRRALAAFSEAHARNAIEMRTAAEEQEKRSAVASRRQEKSLPPAPSGTFKSPMSFDSVTELPLPPNPPPLSHAPQPVPPPFLRAHPAVRPETTPSKPSLSEIRPATPPTTPPHRPRGVVFGTWAARRLRRSPPKRCSREWGALENG